MNWKGYGEERPIIVAARLRRDLYLLARTLGSWVRIPIKAWVSVCVYSVCVVLYM
jgi:hypothetical protein